MPGQGRQFQVGNKGGPGRPSRTAEQDYLKAIRVGCPPADVTEIMRVLVSAALGRDTGTPDLKTCKDVLRIICGNDSAVSLMDFFERLEAVEERQRQGRQRQEETAPQECRPQHEGPEETDADVDQGDGAGGHEEALPSWMTAPPAGPRLF